MVCKSKVDGGVCVFPIVLALIVTVSNICRKTMDIESILLSVFVGGIIYLIFLINMFTITYIFSETELLIRTYMFKRIVRLNEIKSVKLERGRYSLFTASKEQLELVYLDGRKIYISPKELRDVEKYICERKAQV